MPLGCNSLGRVEFGHYLLEGFLSDGLSLLDVLDAGANIRRHRTRARKLPVGRDEKPCWRSMQLDVGMFQPPFDATMKHRA